MTTATSRSAPEIVDAAFNLVRPHYASLVTVSAVAFSPVLILAALGAYVPVLIFNVANLFCVGWAEACLLLGLAALYRGDALETPGALLQRGRPLLGRVAYLAFARNLATYVGLIFLIVPGLFGYAYYALSTPAAAIEGLKAKPAIKRGAALVRGEYGRVIRTNVLMGVIYLLFLVGAYVLASMLTSSQVLPNVAMVVMQILMQPPLVAVVVLLYYDIRERKEGIDIESAIGALRPFPAGAA